MTDAEVCCCGAGISTLGSRLDRRGPALADVVDSRVSVPRMTLQGFGPELKEFDRNNVGSRQPSRSWHDHGVPVSEF